MRVTLLRTILSNEAMEATKKMSPSDRIQIFMDILINYQDDLMSTGAISTNVWDELFQTDSLGNLHPTVVIARALVAQIVQMKDTLVSQTVLEIFKTGNAPKKTKTGNTKEWFDLIKKECNKLQPGSMGEDVPHILLVSSPSRFTATSLTDKMKVEIKLQTYDGTTDA